MFTHVSDLGKASIFIFTFFIALYKRWFLKILFPDTWEVKEKIRRVARLNFISITMNQLNALRVQFVLLNAAPKGCSWWIDLFPAYSVICFYVRGTVGETFLDLWSDRFFLWFSSVLWCFQCHDFFSPCQVKFLQIFLALFRFCLNYGSVLCIFSKYRSSVPENYF